MAFTSEQLLRCLIPLKVIVVTEGTNSEYGAVRAAIHRGFHGGQYSADSAEAYFAAGEDLGVSMLEADFAKDPNTAKRILGETRLVALHTLVVAVIHETPSEAFRGWLMEIDGEAEGEDGDNGVAPENLVGLLPVLLKEGVWLGNTQGLNYLTLDESAMRPAFAAAHALAFSWWMLGAPKDKLKLFISHAKLDGLPLAQSFRGQLENLHGLEFFYDALHIPPGRNWKRILREGVEASAVVALRTNVYEERPWCVQELDWAEDFGCPLVIVEARTHLVRAREFLPVTGSPCVHVPDGNLVRILKCALREALRVRLFARQVRELENIGAISGSLALKVPRTSLDTVGMMCERHVSGGKVAAHIFVPEKFREALRRVAERLVQGYFPGACLGTP